MDKKKDKKKQEKKGKVKERGLSQRSQLSFPPQFVGALADEVAKTLVHRLPAMLPRRRAKKNNGKQKQYEYGIFLDTSAIIDARIFDVIQLGLFHDPIIVPESILAELKHIADSQETTKKERGRKGLELLEKLRKDKKIKLHIIAEQKDLPKDLEVDEKLIRTAKLYHGRIITCDYNLEKKTSIGGGIVINVNALAQTLKVTAIPGEKLLIKVQHLGKDSTQGVGYLDDGTMIVVEKAASDLGNTVEVQISRVLQTAAGRILFAKKI